MLTYSEGRLVLVRSSEYDIPQGLPAEGSVCCSWAKAATSLCRTLHIILFASHGIPDPSEDPFGTICQGTAMEKEKEREKLE